MRLPTRALTAAAVLTLSLGSLAACSSDSSSDGDSDGGSSLQDDVAAQTIEQLQADGTVTVDEACVEEKASQLDDDDAQAILDAELGGDADVSPEAEEIAASLVDCISLSDE